MQADLKNLNKLFFSGIGGSGMSALAQVLARKGKEISGSDRRRDRGESPEIFARLDAQGIGLYPQDGSGVRPDLDAVVVSAAVEKDTPDYRRAVDLGLTVIPRPSLLAALANSGRAICFAGTSGKSTSTAIAAYALTELGFSPNVITGAPLVNYQDGPTTGNALSGDSDLLVIESCESDGSIVEYAPAVGVILNIDRDHHELSTLLAMFRAFAARTRERLVLNADCPNTMGLDLPDRPGGPEISTFSILGRDADYSAREITLGQSGARFKVGRVWIDSPLTGLYNVANVLAALAACEAVGVSGEDFARTLPGFQGIARRFQVLGEAGGVTVIDDFAHNPAKIRAVLSSFESWPGLGRLFVVFQPHGFGPLRFQFEELVRTFSDSLGGNDVLVLPEVYYAGGSAARDISSRDLAGRVSAAGRAACFYERREDSIPMIAGLAGPGDVVLVLGARDDSLSDYAREVLAALEKGSGDSRR